MDDVLIDVFVEAYATPPVEIVLDVDATDDSLYGHQEGRFFHGYYGHCCYLSLYIFCGEQLLCAQLRPSNQEGTAGTEDALARIIPRLRAVCPGVKIIVRGTVDSVVMVFW